MSAGWHPDSPEVRIAGLRRALPDDVVVAGRSALWIMGLDVLPDSGDLHLTIARGRHLERRPGVVTWSAEVAAAETCLVGGLHVVSAARAFVDVARREPAVEAVAVGDAVLRSGLADAALLEESILRARGLRNVRAARSLLPHLEPRSESLMESRTRVKLVRGGLSRPQAQVDLYDADGQHCGRTDLYIEGVALEYDGRRERLDPVRFVDDRRRQTRIAELGVELRRFTGSDVYRRSDASLVAEVYRAMEQACGRDRSSLRLGPDTLRRPERRPLMTLAEQAVREAA